MKTIEEIWTEYKNTNKFKWGFLHTDSIEELRRAFFAGFDKCFDVYTEITKNEDRQDMQQLVPYMIELGKI